MLIFCPRSQFLAGLPNFGSRHSLPPRYPCTYLSKIGARELLDLGIVYAPALCPPFLAFFDSAHRPSEGLLTVTRSRRLLRAPSELDYKSAAKLGSGALAGFYFSTNPIHWVGSGEGGGGGVQRGPRKDPGAGGTGPS
jgi:hypothetical protein